MLTFPAVRTSENLRSKLDMKANKEREGQKPNLGFDVEEC